MRTKAIRASKSLDKNILAFLAPVEIVAAKDGDTNPPRFAMTAYTGGDLDLPNFELPVVVDLAGAKFHKSVKANLNHKREAMVGHVDQTTNDGKAIKLGGAISGGGAAANEVLTAHAKGYPWEASIQANRLKIELLPKGKKAVVNDQAVTGPKYIARESTIYAVAFCDQGADDSTQVTIAASAASKKGTDMDAACKTWVEAMGFTVADLSEDQIAGLEANYKGQNGKKPKAAEPSSPFESRKIEAKRRVDIREIADKFLERRPNDLSEIESIEKMHDHAIEANMTAQDFRNEMYDAVIPLGHTVTPPRRDTGLSNRVLMAAICESGRLSNLDKNFTDQELQAAHSRFPQGISLNEFLIEAARANGYTGPASTRITNDIHNAAYGMNGGRHIHAGGGFSTIDVANIVAATANKFLHEGWMMVDQTALRIARIKSVRNFQQITTVSLTGHLTFEKLGPAGEIKHGVLDDMTYTNQVDTYALMLAITRQDMINDDLGALTAVPRRLGRGGMLKLNDIFWTEFLGLVAAGFFASGNANINTGIADATLAGLQATETIFLNQTDPDGKPVGFEPRIWLVPTAIKATATALVSPGQNLLVTGASATIPNVNPYAGRFRVESSPYISNSSFTGNTAVGNWLLADPSDEAVIEIAALNGKVEPIVETADANFNVLGTQMRGYSDVGVNEQEKRAGVYADGGAS